MTPALAFYKAPGTIIDKAIRIRTGSPYSHVEFLPDWTDRSSRATAWSSSARDGGVRAKVIDFRRDRWDVVPVQWAPSDILDRFEGQRGKKYDYVGVLIGRSLGVPLHCENRWFCFEFVGWGLGLPNPQTLTGRSLYAAAGNPPEDHGRR